MTHRVHLASHLLPSGIENPLQVSLREKLVYEVYVNYEDVLIRILSSPVKYPISRHKVFHSDFA